MNRTEIENRLKENKADRKYLKKQLAEFPAELVIGKWYSNLTYKGCIINYQGMGSSSIIGYGFDFTGEYFESNTIWGAADGYELATETEVFEALKNEAIKRGFKEYMTENFSCLDDGAYWSNRDEFSFEKNKFGLGANIIMKNGKWATIIKEPTIELNGEYTKVQLTDIINNRF
tara:strand:+ start:281 stop:802 length:522 start_codon:yes stop_codon:yes gene_type:complete